MTAKNNEVYIKLNEHLPAIAEWNNEIIFRPGPSSISQGRLDLNLLDRYVEKR